MQTREIREYAERRGWTVAAEYVDGGISGTKEKREVLDRIMADAHRLKFDVVAVWKFDRFPRSVSHPLACPKTNCGVFPRAWRTDLSVADWIFTKHSEPATPR